MAAPKLTFFCELEDNVLKALFSVPDIAYLADLNASVSLGILDLSEERAEVVKRLNESGIPVNAWLLLPKEQGYWLTLDNVDQAVRRYEDFLSWSKAHGLKWDRVGLNVNPDPSIISEFRNLSLNKWRIVKKIAGGVFNFRRLARASREYRRLIDCIRSDGYQVDSYQYPFIIDERKTRSDLIQRATGIADLPVDREVLLLYSSYARPYGPGFLWVYAQEAGSVAVGSTGGGVDLGLLEAKPLSWKEFERDLRLAWAHNSDIHIFSLEGCIRQGYLAKLIDFEWDAPLIEPTILVNRVEAWRAALQSVLWLTGRPLFIGGILAAAAFILWMLKDRGQSRDS